MRVTHVLYLVESEHSNPFSGAENHLWTLLPALAGAGVEVELLAVLMGNGAFPRVHARLRNLRAHGVAVTVLQSYRPRLGGQRLFLALTWLRLWRLLRRRRGRAIHLHLEIKYTPFVARLAGCREIIYSIHNDLPGFREMAGGLRFRLLKRTVRQFIAISERVRGYFLENSGVSPDRLHTIYYGYTPTRLPARTRAEFGLPEDRFVVGFVGRLTPQKNLVALIEAMRTRPHVHCVIVGAGPQRVELEQRVTSASIANVSFLGAISDAAQLMTLFDALCLPSLWEGLGLVLIEAMAAEVPVIGSNCGAIPDILGDGKYGLICEPTADGVGRSIDAAVADPARLQQRAAEARDYALRRFSVERMTTQTITVYHRACTM